VRVGESWARSILNVVDGVVGSGTLEGLVHGHIWWVEMLTSLSAKLTATLGSRDEDVFLISCAEYTIPEQLFQVISRRSYDAEDDLDAQVSRVVTQYKYTSSIE